MTDDRNAVKARADALSPEEVEAGTDDPIAQAAAILEESDERESNRVDPAGSGRRAPPLRGHRRAPDLGRRGSGAEAVEPLRVAGQDQVAIGGGHARERRLDGAPRVGQSDDTCG